MDLSQAYKFDPFVRASRTRAGFGQPQGVTNLKSFFRWVAANDPEFYELVKKREPQLLSVQGRALESGPPALDSFLGQPPVVRSYEFGDYDLSDNDDGYQLGQIGLKTAAVQAANEPPKTSWADKLISLATAAIPIWQQREVMKLQIKRAEKGLPPVDVSKITTPAVRVELAPEIQREITGGLKMGKMAIPILLGIGALFVFGGMGKRRGR